jgi:hypothetical protein
MVWAVYKRTVDGEILVCLYDRESYAAKYVERMGSDFYVQQIEVYSGEIMEG